MSLPQDLLEQAEHLLGREKRKPKQASLRRAVSAAYYALFHLLIDEGTNLIMPDGGPPGSRSQVGRTFGHAELKRVCAAFASLPQKPQEVDWLVQVSNPPPAKLVAVARAFVQLQEERHEADSNTAKRYSRREVSALVGMAGNAFTARKEIQTHPMARTFFIALIVWKKWDRR